MRRFSAAVLALTIGLGAASSIATVPISRMNEHWWRERFSEKQAELKSRTIDIIWLGDSITQNWERLGPEPWLQFSPIWNSLIDAKNSIDLGFKGDSTCHLLWRLTHGELDQVHPKVIVLLIGANNFGRVHTNAEQTFAGVEAIVSLLRTRLPDAHIILLGVLPSIRSTWVDLNTARLNQELKLASKDQAGVTFVDATSLFLSNGRVDPNDFIDPRMTPPEPALHPTAQAQAKVAQLVEPLIREILAQPGR